MVSSKRSCWFKMVFITRIKLQIKTVTLFLRFDMFESSESRNNVEKMEFDNAISISSYKPESPLNDQSSLIGDLTVKIYGDDGEVFDWPARTLIDTRTVPILQFSCNPTQHDHFNVSLLLMDRILLVSVVFSIE